MKKLEIEIECPKCKQKITQRVEDMRPGKSRTCPSCDTTISFAGDDGQKTQKALDDLNKTLDKLGNIQINL